MFRTILTCSLLLLPFFRAIAAQGSTPGLNWPDDRLLPEFPAAAAMVDCIDISTASGPEVDLFSSLEGIVNRTQPRLACVTDHCEEGKFIWLELHHLPYKLISGYDAVAKYQTSATGLVVTDPQQPATVNLATTIAGLNNELICDPSLLATLTNAPYSFTIKDDLRGRFSSRFEVYRFLHDHYWAQCTHRVIAGLGPRQHGGLRDYLVAVKSAVVWLAPGSGGEAEAIMGLFLADMTPAHGVYMGWWPSEADGLKWIGQYGVQVLASDFLNNASLFGGVVKPLAVPAIPPPPPLENKIYVAIILSDGDNVQYMQHHLKKNWGDSARGSVPIGWTVSPLAVDIDPGMLHYYWRTATPNDCLVSGPSGAGYARLNFWSQTNNVAAFTKISDSYLQRSGLRVITVWNKVTRAAADSFAAHCPTLLGLTDQEGGYYTTLHSGLPTIGFPANGSYNPTVPSLLHSINSTAKNWTNSAPMFIALQGNGWDITPAGCRQLADSLDKNKFVVVRPDQLFMLYKQHMGRDLK